MYFELWIRVDLLLASEALSALHAPKSVNFVESIIGKDHHSLIPNKSSPDSSRLLCFAHSDVNGPFETPFIGGFRYFIIFIDDYFRLTTVYTIYKKSDTVDCLKKIRIHRTDNGGEYLSMVFKEYLQVQDIHHQLTIAFTPQQNEISERMNLTPLDLVRSMLSTLNLENEFRAEALSRTVYIRSRVLSRALPKNSTPFHRQMNKVSDYDYLRIFCSKF